MSPTVTAPASTVTAPASLMTAPSSTVTAGLNHDHARPRRGDDDEAGPVRSPRDSVLTVSGMTMMTMTRRHFDQEVRSSEVNFHIGAHEGIPWIAGDGRARWCDNGDPRSDRVPARLPGHNDDNLQGARFWMDTHEMPLKA